MKIMITALLLVLAMIMGGMIIALLIATSLGDDIMRNDDIEDLCNMEEEDEGVEE